MGSTWGCFLPVPIALCLLLGFGMAEPGSGADPVLHMAGYQDGGVRVSCLSSGWYPEPHVLWSNGRGEPLRPASKETPRNADGLFNVSSSVVLAEHSDPTLTCLVRAGASGPQAETTIRITGLFPRQDPEKTASVLLLVTCLLLLVLAPSLCWKIRALRDEASKEKEWKTFLDKVSLSPADVTLDRNTANPFLVLSEGDRRVTCGVFWQDVPKSDCRFDSLPGVLAARSLSAGQRYWEVEVDLGGDWAVGVARDSVERLGVFKPSPDVGVWALQYQEGEWSALTYPPTPLPPPSAPSVVRLHLDCEQGRLAFYDAESMAHIFTFSGCPREPLFPFFLLSTSGTQLTILPPGRSQAKEADGPRRSGTRTQRKRLGSLMERLIQPGKS